MFRIWLHICSNSCLVSEIQTRGLAPSQSHDVRTVIQRKGDFFLIVSFKNTALPKINQKEEKIKPTHNVHIRHVQNIFSFQVQNQISRKVLCLAPLQLLSKQQIIRCSSSFKYGRGHTMMMPPSLNFSVCYIEDFVIVVMEG